MNKIANKIHELCDYNKLTRVQAAILIALLCGEESALEANSARGVRKYYSLVSGSLRDKIVDEEFIMLKDIIEFYNNKYNKTIDYTMLNYPEYINEIITNPQKNNSSLEEQIKFSDNHIDINNNQKYQELLIQYKEIQTEYNALSKKYLNAIEDNKKWEEKYDSLYKRNLILTIEINSKDRAIEEYREVIQRNM
ncbi:hypothetical protein ACPWSR_03865 [Alloiococcus sp. CFN-8]|uniref:hypothetical protein n=1 Tax=Alloiococcus sp. CFN-8 TaxID=3416081 RepID=UPI003CEF5BBF